MSNWLKLFGIINLKNEQNNFTAKKKSWITRIEELTENWMFIQNFINEFGIKYSIKKLSIER